MKSQRGYTIIELLSVAIVLAFLGGWIANVVKFAGMDFGTVTAMLVLRAIGIIAAPLGAILGYL